MSLLCIIINNQSTSFLQLWIVGSRKWEITKVINLLSVSLLQEIEFPTAGLESVPGSFYLMCHAH